MLGWSTIHFSCPTLVELDKSPQHVLKVGSWTLSSRYTNISLNWHICGFTHKPIRGLLLYSWIDHLCYSWALLYSWICHCTLVGLLYSWICHCTLVALLYLWTNSTSSPFVLLVDLVHFNPLVESTTLIHLWNHSLWSIYSTHGFSLLTLLMDLTIWVYFIQLVDLNLMLLVNFVILVFGPQLILYLTCGRVSLHHMILWVAFGPSEKNFVTLMGFCEDVHMWSAKCALRSSPCPHLSLS